MTGPQVVVANVLLKDRKVLLLRRKDNGLWCTPGGKVEDGETVRQAAVREQAEETGMRLGEEYGFLLGYSDIARPGRRTILMLHLLWMEWEGEASLTEPDQFHEFGWFDLNSLPAQNLMTHGTRDGLELLVQAIKLFRV